MKKLKIIPITLLIMSLGGCYFYGQQIDTMFQPKETKDTKEYHIAELTTASSPKYIEMETSFEENPLGEQVLSDIYEVPAMFEYPFTATLETNDGSEELVVLETGETAYLDKFGDIYLFDDSTTKKIDNNNNLVTSSGVYTTNPLNKFLSYVMPPSGKIVTIDGEQYTRYYTDKTTFYFKDGHIVYYVNQESAIPEVIKFIYHDTMDMELFNIPDNYTYIE